MQLLARLLISFFNSGITCLRDSFNNSILQAEIFIRDFALILKRKIASLI